MYNWLFYGVVGNSVCRTWESGSFAFPCAVNRVIHDGIACYAHFHNAFFCLGTLFIIYSFSSFDIHIGKYKLIHFKLQFMLYLLYYSLNKTLCKIYPKYLVSFFSLWYVIHNNKERRIYCYGSLFTIVHNQ